MILNDYELKTIEGGGYKVFAIIGGIALFIAGVVDGIVRPYKCR